MLRRRTVVSISHGGAVVVPLLDAALVLSGVLDLRTGVLVGVVLEALLLVVVAGEAVVFRRAYRSARRSGASRAPAVVAGLQAAWPPVLLRLARAEAGLFRAMWWAVRRRRSVGAGDTPLPYAGRFGLVVAVICFLGALETVVVHVLLPWETVRWVLLAVSVYALVWMVGFGLSLRQHPHLVGEEVLVLRFGHFRSVTVPLAGVVAVRRRVETGHRRTVVCDGDRLVVSVMGDTNVELRVDPTVRLADQAAPVARVAFYVDDPAAAVRELRTRAPDRAG
ncbi:hypothetical protein ACI79D_03595 [Geodermatophilus sp. SYSU D00708]